MTFLEGLTAVHDYVKPMAAPAAGIAAALGAVAAAFWGKWSQARKPEQALSEVAAMSPRATTMRLHPDERELVEDLRESVRDLVKALRRNTKAICDHDEHDD